MDEIVKLALLHRHEAVYFTKLLGHPRVVSFFRKSTSSIVILRPVPVVAVRRADIHLTRRIIRPLVAITNERLDRPLRRLQRHDEAAIIRHRLNLRRRRARINLPLRKRR